MQIGENSTFDSIPSATRRYTDIQQPILTPHSPIIKFAVGSVRFNLGICYYRNTFDAMQSRLVTNTLQRYLVNFIEIGVMFPLVFNYLLTKQV